MKATFSMIFILFLGCLHEFTDLTPDADADAGDGVSDLDGDVISDAGDGVSDSDGDVISDDSISDGDGSDSGCDPALLGLPCEAGVGACRRSGVTICLSPGSVGCDATPGTPTTEICDDLDNDCDGESDEDLVGCCTVGEHAPCGTDVGECELGDKECLPGEIWSDCSGGQGPTTETCDELDNDCDSLIDEDFDFLSDVSNCGSCGNVCNLPHASVEGCSGGSCIVVDCETPSHVDVQYFDVDRIGSNGCEYACSATFKFGHEVYWGPEDPQDEDCDGATDEPVSRNLILYVGFSDVFSDCVLDGPPMADYSSGTVGDVLRWRSRDLWTHADTCPDGVLVHRTYGSPPFSDTGYLFDGVDDYVYWNDSTDLDSIGSAFTFFIWVKPETLEDGDYVIWREPSDQFSLKMRSIGGHFKWQFCISSSSCGTTTSDIVRDTWTLLTFAYSAGTVQIYVNAVAEGSFAGSFSPGGEMRMGGDGSSHSYNGFTDEIALYNVALPASDISWYYEFARPRP